LGEKQSYGSPKEKITSSSNNSISKNNKLTSEAANQPLQLENQPAKMLKNAVVQWIWRKGVVVQKNIGRTVYMSRRKEGDWNGWIDHEKSKLKGKKSPKTTSQIKIYQLRKKWLGRKKNKKLGLVKILGSVNHQT
jgi:hypothetical protein